MKIAILSLLLLLSACGSNCTGLEHVFGNEADRARCGEEGFALSYSVDVDLSGVQYVMPRNYQKGPY